MCVRFPKRDILTKLTDISLSTKL